MDGRLHRRRGAGLSFFMGGDGAPLLLLHGVPGSAWSWHKVGIKLTSRFRVILPDLMGFGMSDPPTQGVTAADQADALRRLLDYLQIDDFYLGGHGFGGAVAVLLMQRHPDLRVRGLTLAASHLLTDQPLAASVGWVPPSRGAGGCASPTRPRAARGRRGRCDPWACSRAQCIGGLSPGASFAATSGSSAWTGSEG